MYPGGKTPNQQNMLLIGRQSANVILRPVDYVGTCEYPLLGKCLPSLLFLKMILISSKFPKLRECTAPMVNFDVEKCRKIAFWKAPNE